MTAEPQIDPMSAIVALATLAFAPEIAAVIGPYLLIMFASTIGASFALAARETSGRLSAAWFFLRINGLALLLTYAVTTGVNAMYPIEDQRAWFAPVAFVIGFIGDRWPRLLNWAGDKVAHVIDALISMRTGGKGPGGDKGHE